MDSFGLSQEVRTGLHEDGLLALLMIRTSDELVEVSGPSPVVCAAMMSLPARDWRTRSPASLEPLGRLGNGE